MARPKVRSSDLSPRDLAILRHIGLYRIGLYPVLGRMFFAGKSCGGVLGRLAKDDDRNLRPALVSVEEKAIAKRYNYATLRQSALQLIEVPENRTGTIGAVALSTAVAIAWFCCCGRSRRFRLETREVESLLGLPAKTVPDIHNFAASTEDLGRPVLLRLHHALANRRMRYERSALMCGKSLPIERCGRGWRPVTWGLE